MQGQKETASKINLVSSISQSEIFGLNSQARNKLQPLLTQTKVRVERSWDFEIIFSFNFQKNFKATWLIAK